MKLDLDALVAQRAEPPGRHLAPFADAAVLPLPPRIEDVDVVGVQRGECLHVLGVDGGGVGRQGMRHGVGSWVMDRLLGVRR